MEIYYSELKLRSSIGAYLAEIDLIPLLSREEEERLARSYAECCQTSVRQNRHFCLCPSCRRAKEKLIVSNLRFVVSVAKHYQNRSLSLGDLISEGNLGLITAADKFDHSRGFHFISYAVWWIRQCILKALQDKARVIRLPMNRSRELGLIRNFEDSYCQNHGASPTPGLVAESLHIKLSEVQKLGSLSAPILEDNLDGEDGPASLHTPEDETERSCLGLELRGIICLLPKREQYVIERRYGFNDGKGASLAQIGDELHLTKERIRQLEKQAVGHLREFALKKEIPLFL